MALESQCNYKRIKLNLLGILSGKGEASEGRLGQVLTSVVPGGFPPLKAAQGSVRKRRLDSACLDPTLASLKLCNLE